MNAFAGVQSVLASGGSYGIYAKDSGPGGTTGVARPVPTLAAITLLDQTTNAIVQGNDTLKRWCWWG